MDAWVAFTLNNAAMNMGVQVSIYVPAFNFSGDYPKVRLLGHLVILCLAF